MLNYNEFVKRSVITKSARFELIPQGKTMDFIKEHEDLEQDKRFYEAAERLRPVIDSYVKDIASRALLSVDFDFAAMHEAKESKDKKAYDKEVKALEKVLSKAVDNAMPEGYNVKQINSAQFLQEALREYVLHTKDADIKKDEALADIEGAKGYTALFNKFLDSRITALATWMLNRVVENFGRYLTNASRIKKVLEAGSPVTDGIEDELLKMADVSYYSQVLSQADIDGYNSVISGSCDESGTIQKGLNQKINEYNQKVKNEKKDVPYLRKVDTLYKQILMPAEKKFTIETIETDDEVRNVIKSAWKGFETAADKMTMLLKSKQDDDDGNGILVQGNKLHAFSHLVSGDHKLIADRIMDKETQEINKLLEDDSLKKSMRKELEKRLELVPLKVTEKNYEMTALDEYVQNADKSLLAQGRTAFGCFVESYAKAVSTAKSYYKIIEGGDVLKGRRIKGDRHVQEMLVDFFGALTDVRNILAIIKLPKNEIGDVIFYNDFDELVGDIRDSYKAENLVRNYVTKSVKDTAEEKQTCLGTASRLKAMWWTGDKKFSKDNATIIEYEGKYYYFILSGGAKPIMPAVKADGDAKFLAVKKGQDSNKMMPKIVFSDHAKPFFEANPDADEYIFDTDQVKHPITITRDLYNIYKDKTYVKEALTSGRVTEEEFKRDLKKLINKYKEFADAYVQYEKFDMNSLGNAESYADSGEFFADVDTHSTAIWWNNVDFEQIENLVDNGEAYLFLISNRFLYTGKEDKNAYTKMLLTLVSKENMEKTSIRLNGAPAIFFRPQAVEKKVTHKTGSFLVNRRTEDGEPIPKDIYETIYKIKNGMSSYEDSDYKKAMEYMDTHKVRVFRAKMDMIRNKRYMEDKFFLQISYKKNMDISARSNDRLNDRVRESMRDGFNMVSVARSTSDMVYVMAIDDKQNILEERSLNVIDGIDYAALLHDAYKEKLSDKKSWVYDTDSADLKAAYVDTAITEVLKLARKYNAVIVVESISDQVKDKYSFLDNQVFKTFEKRIAARLSDLSFKDIEKGKPGSIENPLQLANNNGNAYQDGVLFFVNGAYTRGVDPSTGFANLFDTSRINSIASKRQFFSKMNDIRLDGDKITFKFDYNNYPVKYETEKTDWTVTMQGSVVIYDREKKTNIQVDDVVNDVLVPLADGADLSGNLAEKMVGKLLPGIFVDELFKQFRYTIVGLHRKTKDSGEFFRSPVSGTEENVCHAAVLNLSKKMLFRMGYKGTGAQFTKDWLDHIQK